MIEGLEIFFYAFFGFLSNIISAIWNSRFQLFELFKTINSLKPLNILAIYLGIPTIIISIIIFIFKSTNKKQKS